MADISLVIPCFNEEKSIGKLLTALSNDPFTNKCEIIIVDDGSSDDSTKIVESYKCAKLVKHLRNQGYGQAIVTGMQNSTRENVVWMDADGQHQPQPVPVHISLSGRIAAAYLF